MSAMDVDHLPVVDFQGEDRTKQQKVLKRKREQARLPKKLKKAKTASYLAENRDNEAEGPGTGFGSAVSTILSKEYEAPILPNYVPEESKETILAKKLHRQQQREVKERRMLLDRGYLELNYSNEDWERESKYKKIATAGVVQLFNAVRNLKKDQERAAKSSGEPVLQKGDSKEKFLAVLKAPVTVPASKTNQKEVKEEPKWGVLSENYLLNPKMKDWGSEKS